jgi:uncharacterized membrane protein
MKKAFVFITKTVLVGLLIIIPLYLAILLVLKGMKSVLNLVRPLADLLPDSLPADQIVSLLFVLVICFLVGMAVRTRMGQSGRQWIEKTFFERIPGYALLRSLTERMVGEGNENVWKPALIEIEDALVPGFIIEEFVDGRYTVFVPSIPTPFAGAVYILERQRVHPVDVPFTEAIKVISRWGSGSQALVIAMEKAEAGKLNP